MSIPRKRGVSISVIIPLYNGQKYIEQAIRSVWSQTLPTAELIVVDDGSTDAGPQIVHKLAEQGPIKIIRKPNGGQSSARNLGASASNGDFLAFLDQDDAWYPRHLQVLVDGLKHPRAGEIGWVYSNLDEVDESGALVRKCFLNDLSAEHPKRTLAGCLAQDMFVLPSASLISRRAFEKVGGFDPGLSGYEDDDLFLRLFRAGFENIYINEPLSKWRVYSGSSSYSGRMARSRGLYAQKLIDAYPNEPRLNRYYVRDLIAPRFVASCLHDFVQSLREDDTTRRQLALDGLTQLVPYLPESRRAKLLAALPLLRNRHMIGVLRRLPKTVRKRMWRMAMQ
jgi:glycosyltransferase involved in cell wall biosynthesis